MLGGSRIEFADKATGLDAMVGQIVSLHGRVIVGEGDRAFLASSYERYRAGERLLIDDGGRLSNELYESFPAYGGATVSFEEEAWLSGIIERREQGLILSPRGKCLLRRGTYQLDVSFEGRHSATTKS